MFGDALFIVRHAQRLDGVGIEEQGVVEFLVVEVQVAQDGLDEAHGMDVAIAEPLLVVMLVVVAQFLQLFLVVAFDEQRFVERKIEGGRAEVGYFGNELQLVGRFVVKFQLKKAASGVADHDVRHEADHIADERAQVGFFVDENDLGDQFQVAPGKAEGMEFEQMIDNEGVGKKELVAQRLQIAAVNDQVRPVEVGGEPDLVLLVVVEAQEDAVLMFLSVGEGIVDLQVLLACIGQYLSVGRHIILDQSDQFFGGAVTAVGEEDDEVLQQEDDLECLLLCLEDIGMHQIAGG